MSYILDALKKSEQQRQGEAAPAVQTLQRPAVTRSQRRSSLWLPVILVVLVGNAALFAGIWWLQQSDYASTAPEPAVAAAVSQAPTPTPAAVSPAPIEPVPTAPVSNPRVQELWEIPDHVRARLPALTYSFHVYSSDPERRTIIINDKRMREGSAITDDLVLERITEDGVILGFEGHRVQVKVLEGW